MKQPLFMSHGVANKTFIELAQDAGEGVMFPAGKLLIADVIPDTDPRKEVLLAYAADFPAANDGRSADTFGGHAYDALMLVVDALKAVGSDKAKMRDHLEGVKDFKGISGVFNFSPTDHAGLTKDAFAFVEIKGGKWVPVGIK
jgi:branched-chain amino acid transport system substrate-binding protein